MRLGDRLETLRFFPLLAQFKLTQTCLTVSRRVTVVPIGTITQSLGLCTRLDVVIIKWEPLAGVFLA